ncbi:MAG: MoaD/ThiS family protein [Candidatus Sericytochromatia bacterium]|nr:MoaD/ThiS family protein [Candidatus Tanganyikabacteria bacterium]
MRVKLFAALRDHAGGDHLDVEIPEGATVADLQAALRTALPEAAPLLGASRIAINLAFAIPATVVHASDDVAVIPPVSGG